MTENLNSFKKQDILLNLSLSLTHTHAPADGIYGAKELQQNQKKECVKRRRAAELSSS